MSSPAISSTQRSGKKMVVTGRTMSGLVILFMGMDAVGKFFRPEAVVKGTVELGFSSAAILPIGVVLLICTLLYAIPRTAFLGAILLTGYLGGAVATQVRVGHPLFGYVLFPVYFGILLWGGLYGRDAQIRALVPLRTNG